MGLEDGSGGQRKRWDMRGGEGKYRTTKTYLCADVHGIHIAVFSCYRFAQSKQDKYGDTPHTSHLTQSQ